MPNQIMPIGELDQLGLVYDRPAPALPPNAFSDALNVRFKDGAIRKMQGEVNLFPNLFDDSNNQIGGVDANFDGSFIKYVVFWPNPNIIGGNAGYYLVINEESRLTADGTVPPPGNTDPVQQRDIAYLVSVDGTQKVQKGIFEPAGDGEWSHTFFQGGFALIINNGIDIPSYILDDDGNTDINAVPNFFALPGWESYNVNQVVLQDAFNPNADSYIFDIGKQIDFDNNEILVQRINSKTPATITNLIAEGDTGVAGTANNPGFVPPDSSGITSSNSPFNVADVFQIYNDAGSNSTILNLPINLSASGVDTVIVTIRSRNPVQVRCRVIRAFGDFLVAGALYEQDQTDTSITIRSLPGVVRASDVAPPGSVPNNWNPFAAGVSTAEEFVVSDTNAVVDMCEMQGNLYVYTNDNISVLRRTGNPQVPLSISPVTDSYGCQTTNAVLEFEGKQIVVGSRDVYLFSGNPSGIQSVADGRVRKYLFNNMTPIGPDRLFLLDNKQREEIWICYPTRNSVTADCDEALIWSYRNMTWTRRTLRGVVAGSTGPIPGGGLPSTNIDLTGTTGDNGVTNVGSYEVRTVGIDPAYDFLNEHLIYTGDGTALVYGAGRLGDSYRIADEFGDRPFYIVPELPTVRITGPEGTSHEFQFTDTLYTTLTATEMWSQIQTEMESLDGWTFSTLPTGYVQETGTVRLIATEDMADTTSGKRDVDSAIPFEIEVVNDGSSNSNNTIATNLVLKDSTAFADIYGVTVNGAVNDWRGSFVKRATPTVMAISLANSSVVGGEEVIFLSYGDAGDYDPATHTGTNNGITYTDEQTAEAWINQISRATDSLIVTDGGISGEFSLVNAGYSEGAGVINDIRLNSNSTDAQWIYDKYQSALAGSIYLNPFSSSVYSNPVNLDGTDPETLEVASNSPAIAGTLDTQYTQDPARTPDYGTSFTVATMSAAIVTDSIFDVDRPWRSSEVNLNLEFPIFASRMRVDGPTERHNVNKILAADIGWTVPAFDYNPRVETVDADNFTYTIANNDAPTSYNSYVERKQMNISPDMDTESISEFAIWASGSYTPTLLSDPVYNRLQIRVAGTDNPGQEVDLTTVVPTRVKKNNLFISEGYKLDTRLHGRYLSIRLTDEILDNDDTVLPATSNTKKTTNTVFSQNSLWEVSGIQGGMDKGGRR